MASSEENLTALQKMTRSLSFKLSSNTTEKTERTTSTPSKPKKIVNDNWLRDNTKSRKSVKESPPKNLSALNSVGAKASLWSKVANQHLEKQSLNPFSDTFDRDKLKGLLCSKDDPNYGRPDRNSASAIRAAAGEAKMRGEICDVCEVIFHQGQRTEGGEAAIQFGELFSIYNRINDKVVGLLIRARKKDLLSFEGEMLYQGKDDDEWIILTRSINSIREYFGRDGDIPGGGDCPEKRKKSFEAELPPPIPDICEAPIEETESKSEHGNVTGIQTAPPDKRRNKLLNQSLRNSFRKLVKPLYKRRDSGVEESSDDEDNASFSLSRRGSHFSCQSNLSKARSNTETEDNSDKKDQVQSRWRKVLGITRAVGRFSVLSRNKDCQDQE